MLHSEARKHLEQSEILIRRDRSRESLEYYAPCSNCVKHPHYTQLPVTLHRGDTCLVCMKASKAK